MTLSLSAVADEIQTKHEQMLYPVVRVSYGPGGGSGTVLYSEDRGDGCQTYILTNHHVIANAIKIKTEWSSLLQADVKKEFNDPVKVEVFRYVDGSRQDVMDSYRAEIVAHHKEHDLAIVKLGAGRQLEYTATLLEADQRVTIFEKIWAVGCSLQHPPVVTEGIIDYLDDVMDRKVYWMGSAQIIYGNSGGAVFTKKDDRYYFIGVPSRVGVIGHTGQAIPHMSYFVPVPRVRSWLADEQLEFLLDPTKLPAEAFKAREKLRTKVEWQMKIAKEQAEAQRP
jgi:S1-C subfamily serine protease